MNPLLQGLTNPQAKQLMQMVQMAQNPQAAIQQMAQSNPQMQQAIQYVNANGGNPQEAFYKLAKEKGIDPQTVLNSLM